MAFAIDERYSFFVDALRRDPRWRPFHATSYELVAVTSAAWRYVRGAVPKCRRKARLKDASELKPVDSEICVTLARPERSSSAARASRVRARHRIGGSPGTAGDPPATAPRR